MATRQLRVRAERAGARGCTPYLERPGVERDPSALRRPGDYLQDGRGLQGSDLLCSGRLLMPHKNPSRKSVESPAEGPEVTVEMIGGTVGRA